MRRLTGTRIDRPHDVRLEPPHELVPRLNPAKAQAQTQQWNAWCMAGQDPTELRPKARPAELERELEGSAGSADVGVSPHSAVSARVSSQMSRMPRRDTKPELQIRRLLHARGLRYRVDDKRLPGRPDIVFAGARLAVFVDGCFWHACPEHGVLPKNNREWWRVKLAANVERDRRKDENLWTLGWSVLHVWEHEQPLVAAERIASAVASGTRRRAP